MNYDKKNVTSFDSRKTNLYLIVVFLLIVGILPASCTEKKLKEKTSETKAIGCQILDELPKDIAKPLEVNYGGKVVYIGTTVEKPAQNQLKISYYWQLKNELDKYKQIFVHFTDNKNSLLFQNDHEFCAKSSFEELKGKIIKDTYLVGIPESAIGKEINIKIGIYIPEGNGPRLKVESAGETPIDENNTRALVDKLSP